MGASVLGRGSEHDMVAATTKGIKVQTINFLSSLMGSPPFGFMVPHPAISDGYIPTPWATGTVSGMGSPFPISFNFCAFLAPLHPIGKGPHPH
ncbi:MAG: hypothetical protein C4332_12620 [Meiothermus sp.]